MLKQMLNNEEEQREKLSSYTDIISSTPPSRGRPKPKLNVNGTMLETCGFSSSDQVEISGYKDVIVIKKVKDRKDRYSAERLEELIAMDAGRRK